MMREPAAALQPPGIPPVRLERISAAPGFR